MKKWILVVLEAIDWGGKDTQADLLVSRYGFVKTRLPLYEHETWPILKRHISESKENCPSELYFQLIMSANYIDHLHKVIKPLIESWKNVVMTRFSESMRAYSSAFTGSIDPSIKEISRVMDWEYWKVCGNVKQIHIQIPLSVSMDRIALRDKNSDQKKEDVFENSKILSVVKSYYDTRSQWSFETNGWRKIEEIHEDIVKYLKL